MSQPEGSKPLGLLNSFLEGLDAETASRLLAKLRGIEEFDISGPRNAYHREMKLRGAHDSVELLERELKRFLALSLVFPQHSFPWVPAKKVDSLWHHFILDTPKYRRFCDSIFGAYIDHEPSDTRGKTLAAVAGEVFADTQRCLTTAFGALPPTVWGVAGRCDTEGKCHETCNSP